MTRCSVTIVGTNDARKRSTTSRVIEDVQRQRQRTFQRHVDHDSVLTVAHPGTRSASRARSRSATAATRTPSNATCVLTTGDLVSDVFSYQAFDGFETPGLLIVTISGKNDGPYRGCRDRRPGRRTSRRGQRAHE